MADADGRNGPAPDSATTAAMAAVLARAFLDDPVMQYIFPGGGDGRLAKLEWLMRRWVRVMAPRGEARLTPDGGGAIIWLPPGAAAEVSLWTQLAVGLAWAPLRLGAGAVRRFLAVDADVKRRHTEHLASPHFVLDILGVVPERQRCGTGSALVGELATRADAAGHPSYLVTHNPRNLPFYARFGFVVVEAAPVREGGPTAWSLRRPPTRQSSTRAL